MKFTEIKNDGLERHFKVTIPTKTIEPKISTEIAKLSKTARVDGFRVGKVPASMIDKKYGASVRGDVVSHEIHHAINDIIKETKLNIVGNPAIDDLKSESGKDVEFNLILEIMPNIEMPNFKDIKISKPVLDVSEKDIEKRMDEIANMRRTFTDRKKGSKAVDGDMVVIDFVGSVDGVEFPGGKAEGHKLVLGSKSFIPGFEDQLIGTKAGEEVLVKVQFPDAYHAKDLAGKDSEFKVTVHNVQSPVKAEINDDFAKEVGFKDLTEFKDKLKEEMGRVYEEHIYTMMKMKLFDALESSLTFEAPKSMFNNEYNLLKSQLDNIKDDDALDKKSPEEIEKYCRRVSERRVKVGLLLSEYVKKHNLKIENQDIKDAILKEARNFPGQENAVIEYYSTNKKAIQSLTGPVLEEKAVKAIFANEVTMKDKKYSNEALEKLLEEEANTDVI